MVGQYNLSIASTVVAAWAAVHDLFIAAVFAIIFGAVVYHSMMWVIIVVIIQLIITSIFQIIKYTKYIIHESKIFFNFR